MQLFIYLFAFSFFFEVYQIFGFGTTGITISDFITLSMFLYFIKIVIWDGKELKISKNPAILFLFLFYGITFVSGFAPIFRGSQGEIIQFIKSTSHYHFTVLFLTINILANNKNETWDNFIKIWIVLSIFINIFGIYQIIARPLGLPFAWMEFNNLSYLSRGMYETMDEVPQISLRFENFFRATSVFSEPSALASFNAIILVFLIVPYVQNFKPFLNSNFLTITASVFSVLGIFLAFSLTGLSAFGLVILSIIIFEKFKNLGLFVKIFIAMIIFLIIADQIVSAYSGVSVLELFYKRVYGVINYLMTNQLSAIEGESFSGRSDNVEAMFNIFRHNPIWGTGLGLTYISPYAEGYFFADITIMAVLAETGIFGFIGYFGFFAIFLFIATKFLIFRDKLVNLEDNEKRILLMLFYILMVYFVVNYLSGNQLYNVFSLIILSLVFNVVDNYYINRLNKYYTLKLVKIPLSVLFNNYIYSYIHKMKRVS